MRQFIIFAGLALVGSAAGAVTVLNPSFELGVNPGKSKLLVTGDIVSLPGWKVVGNNIDIVGTAWQASDGVRSIDLSGTTTGGILQTIHGLTPGTAYTVTFDLSGSYSGVRTSANRMEVLTTGNATQIFTYNLNNVTTNMMYQTHTYNFTPTQNLTVLRFNGLDDSVNGAVLDNVRIAPASSGSLLGGISGVGGTVPEPAMWAMMVGGFALTGASMRRRKAGAAIVAA